MAGRRGPGAGAAGPRRPLAAVDVVAAVYVMGGAFACRHLLAGARRHLTQTLRGRRAEPGLDRGIVQTAIDGSTRPVGRGRETTANLQALYPRENADQAVGAPAYPGPLQASPPVAGRVAVPVTVRKPWRTSAVRSRPGSESARVWGS